MLLNESQAAAIASSMCSLNNVGALLDANFPNKSNAGEFLRVRESDITGEVLVTLSWGGAMRDREIYADQNAFLTAYGQA